jgi:plastocyanin
MKTATITICLEILAGTALVLSGCNKSEPSGNAAPASAKVTATAGAGLKSSVPAREAGTPSMPKRPATLNGLVAPKDSAVIAGMVVYQGTPPQPKAVNFGPEKVCASLHPDKPPFYETLVVNPNGTLKWAMVGIRGAVPGKYAPSEKPVIVDQVGCVFTPHVVGALVGQDIEFHNSDPVTHNIRSSATRNSSFNNNFAPKSITKTKFESPEIGIPLKCDIHFWMSAHIHVFAHPFFAITGDDGSFVISGVPTGNYTLVAWHETLKTQTQTITLKAGEVTMIDIVFNGAK